VPGIDVLDSTMHYYDSGSGTPLLFLVAAESAWEEFWAATRPVELTPAVEQQAGQLAKSYALRGADAVHLASVLAINDLDLVVAVWDRRLHTGVLTAGLRVAPVNLDADIPPPTSSGGLT
jgi:hypothetical protein